MKQIRLILAIVLVGVLSQSANAFPIFIDQFEGYATGRLGDNGTGGENNWLSARTRIAVTNLTPDVSLDGTGLGLVASAGDMVYIGSTANTNDNFDTNTVGIPNGTYNKFVPSGTFPPTTNANIYCSFLYRFNDNTNFPASGASMIAGLYLQSGGIQSANGADAYWQLFARTNSSGNLQIGLAKNVYGTNATVPQSLTNWESTTVTTGQTFFVVVRLQIAATTNNTTAFTNDEDDLWINPPPNSFGTNEANVPVPDVSVGPNTGPNVPSSGTGPGRFFIVDDGLTANLDEVRISTNWSEVTPPFGQCLSASFTTQPTNVTQSAEINALFFTRAANSTGPSYQWQLSKDGGVTWSNISGANFRNYTTPNLQLATDNGNKYRAIVNVACDGSSATSSVATVTLTAPTVTTSPSLIMDDTFTDTDRTTGPVSANNSVWWTAVTADLDADPADTGINNALVATPITNTSSLYLGYFVNDVTSRLPVHLAVGAQIAASLSITPDTFAHFTNNGPLRLGLFDYADNGTFATADNTSTLTGSAGQGINVRGYMLDLDFGKNFSTSNPMTLYVRDVLGDNNLMGTTGDYTALGDGGPLGIDYSNAPAFATGSNYVLTLTVARVGTNTCSVNGTLTGSGLNLSYTAIDTNGFGYHRFDAMALRPNRLENAPDRIIIPEFKVQLSSAPVTVASLVITSIKNVPIAATNNVTLTWQSAPSGSDNSAGYSVWRKTSLTNANWTLMQAGIITTNFTDTNGTNSARFYRVTYP